MRSDLFARLRNFFESSIRNRLIIVLVFATVVPVGVSTILSYIYSKQQMQRIAVSENRNLLSQSEISINNYMQTLLATTLTMYSNSRIYNILEYGSDSNLGYETRPYVMSTLLSILSSNQSISQVHLSSTINDSSYLMTERGFFSESESLPIPEENGPFDILVIPTHISHTFGMKPSTKISSTPVFSIRRIISSIPEKKYLGILTIDANLSYLFKVLTSLMNDPLEIVEIISKDGTVICSTDTARTGTVSDNGWASELYAASETAGEIRGNFFANENQLLIYQKMSFADQEWILYKSIPESFLYREANSLVRTVLAVSVFFLAVSLFLMIRISFDFTDPIRQLNDHMLKIQNGETDTPIEIHSKNEIGMLAKSFNSMMDTIKEMITNEYQLKLTNKTNQLSALQAQIDSHFINNAIQSIGAIALRAGQTEIYKLLSSFGEMFNYSMNLQPFVPMQDEIDYTENYFELQKQRFSENLSYMITYDPDILNVIVPKMLLQPIIENYFKHGFASSYNGGSIYVEITGYEDTIFISVEDDGAGITEEKLEKIKYEISQISNTSIKNAKEHIGIVNIASRLFLYYSGQASLDFGNLETGGFFIHITVPKQIKDNYPQRTVNMIFPEAKNESTDF